MGLLKLLNERLSLANYDKYAKIVAVAYKHRPDKDNLRSWEVLRKHNLKMFKQLQSRIDVIWTEDEPYDSAGQMKKEVLDTGKMYITTQYSDNLMSGWSEEDNWKFRAVHDYIVHIGGNHDFSLKGEIGAFNTHAKIAPRDAMDALFSEVVGQVCYVDTYDEFPNPQKACILYGFDYDKLGDIDWTLYRKNFTENVSNKLSDEQIDTIINKFK